jgi:hypothetical protein
MSREGIRVQVFHPREIGRRQPGMDLLLQLSKFFELPRKRGANPNTRPLFKVQLRQALL